MSLYIYSILNKRLGPELKYLLMSDERKLIVSWAIVCMAVQFSLARFSRIEAYFFILDSYGWKPGSLY